MNAKVCNRVHGTICTEPVRTNVLVCDDSIACVRMPPGRHGAVGRCQQVDGRHGTPPLPPTFSISWLTISWLSISWL